MAELVETLTIVALPPAFDAGDFSSGQIDVDNYLRGRAAADQAAGVTRTYLVYDGDELVGYVSVSCDSIRLTGKERPTKRPTAPALKIGLMGVRTDYRGRRYQGRTIGLWLLDWVVGLARSLSTQVGLRYVTLDSLPETHLVAWYSRYGFQKNMAEERAEKILRQSGRADLREKALDEIELPQINMRFDIRLQEESTN